MDWITTSTILARLSEPRNHEAWEHLVARFRPPIVGFARRLGCSETDAEDVGQETLAAFVEAYRRNRYDRTRGRLSGWLFGIAYRQAMAARRRQAQAPEDGGTTAFETPEEASKSWDLEWEQALLAECLGRVQQEVESATYRAFRLTALEHRSPATVADELGTNVKQVYNAKHRVLKRIRELRVELEEAP